MPASPISVAVIAAQPFVAVPKLDASFTGMHVRSPDGRYYAFSKRAKSADTIPYLHTRNSRNPLRRRRFCSGQSIKAQPRATACRGEAATHSVSITCGLQNPIGFNKRWNLVRDQGVGGSNPLSPTNILKHLNCASGFPSTSVVSKL